jgi:hypothetical protein
VYLTPPNVNHAIFGKAFSRAVVRTFLSFTLLLGSGIPLSRLRLPTSARRQRNGLCVQIRLGSGGEISRR